MVDTTSGASAGACDAAVDADCPLASAIGHTADNGATPDVIDFAIPGPPPYVIDPDATLPGFAFTTIRGETQPGFAGEPLIEMVGSGDATRVIDVGQTATISYLVIRDFTVTGVTTSSTGHTLSHLRVGTNRRARRRQRRRAGGILVTSNTMIEDSLVSGITGGSGILSHAGNVTINRTRVGTNASGTAAIPNANGVTFTTPIKAEGGRPSPTTCSRATPGMACR